MKTKLLAILLLLTLGLLGAAPSAVRDLRDSFRRGETGEAPNLIARLSIMRVEPTVARLVRVDHPFSSGDRFRFTVSSNRRGWLYVFHRSSTGKHQQLWPQKDSRGGAQQQEVKVGQSYLIPPSPATFVFDDDASEEEFMIAIRSQNTPPNVRFLDSTALSQSLGQGVAPDVAPDRAGKKTEPNIVIRDDPFDGDSSRGIVFDPGTDDSDPHLYFSAVPGDDMTKAIINFRLRHAK